MCVDAVVRCCCQGDKTQHYTVDKAKQGKSQYEAPDYQYDVV